ncbi:MAG: thiamine phosphate synthase [Bacillota bacterium]|nr:thiamine phosphate synthase [Bacillota bacterium]
MSGRPGAGPAAREVRRRPDPAALARRLAVYVITDREQAERLPGRSLMDVCRAALRAGAGALQLRGKDWSGRELYEAGLALRRLADETGALLFVDDRVDVARAVGADGVHVGQEDLPARVAREILGPGAIVGVSAASPEEARRAEADGADYVGAGSVWATGSKPDAGAPIGLEGLRAIVAVTRLPVVAIGGVDARRAREARAAGAAGVAVISAVMAAPDPARAVRELLAAGRASPASV